jgi:glucosamine--fructose-6-phosphate aminotransferase (isomerizing)
VAITNEPGSALAAAAAHVMPVRAGEEVAVAATKTYVACLVALAALVARWIGTRRLGEGLDRLPAVLRDTLPVAAAWVERSGVVPVFAAAERALVVSRGYDLATALEIALKLQETAGLFAIGYSTADLEHGPVALARPDVPVLAIRPDGDAGRRIDGALERVRAAGVQPWIVGGQETPSERGAPRSGGHSLRLPLTLPIELQPACLVVPGQLLAEAVARARLRDPDRPEGLTKVTQTR